MGQTLVDNTDHRDQNKKKHAVVSYYKFSQTAFTEELFKTAHFEDRNVVAH